MSDTQTESLATELLTAIHNMRRLKLTHEADGCPSRAERHLISMIQGCGKDAITPSELATLSGTTMAAITHHLNALEKTGHLERKNSSTDRRVVQVSLTDKGMEAAAKQKAKYLGMIEFLGEEDVRKLIGIISKMTGYMEEKRDPSTGSG